MNNLKKRKFPLTMSELVAIIALLAVAVMAVIGRQAIFSPGPLNAQASPNSLGGVYSHAELSGECNACHAPPWSSDTMAERCLKCHSSVALEFQNPHDLHSMAVLADKTLTCTGGCHTDHEGATAALTLVSGEHFSGKQSGFSLEGHQTNSNGLSFVCMDCHPIALDKFDLSICTTCHRQIDAVFTTTHLADFGQDCLKCHDGLDTYGKAFDHNQMTFPLEGKHAEAPCGDCHPEARTAFDLRTTSQDCNSCHKQKDKHLGSLGTECAQCHNTTDWKQATIDHAQTAFSLTGKHNTVPCASCHLNGVFKGTHKDCYSCHKSKDKHLGSLGTNCAQCHNTTDWKQATIDHAQTAFLLTGKHNIVPCASCHLNGVFKGTPKDCYSCHKSKDKHLGSMGTNCAQCHNTTDWKQATINHNLTAFPLTGRHTSISCASCHPSGVYKGTLKDCYSCHRSDDEHRGRNGTNCAQCHNTRSWDR